MLSLEDATLTTFDDDFEKELNYQRERLQKIKMMQDNGIQYESELDVSVTSNNKQPPQPHPEDVNLNEFVRENDRHELKRVFKAARFFDNMKGHLQTSRETRLERFNQRMI